MKIYFVLLSIGVALSNPIDVNPSTRIYPEIITDIQFIENATVMDFDELINKAVSHAGLEWLKDEEALAQAGIDITKIHPDIIVDALSTTVRIS